MRESMPVIWHRFTDDAEVRRAVDADGGGASLTIPAQSMPSVGMGTQVMVLFCVGAGQTHQVTGKVEMMGASWTVGVDRGELDSVLALTSARDEERRALPRSRCWLQAAVQTRDGVVLRVTACNLGLGGVGLSALHAELAPGAEVTVTFSAYPPLQARVAWCAGSGLAGLAFADDPATKAALAVLVADAADTAD